MLFLGLLLACEVLDAPVDETISRAIRADATTQGLARAVIERYRRQTDEETPDFAQMWRFNLKARERRRDRLRCRFRLMAPALRPNQRDFQFVRLPRRLSFFYHAVKPVRLATKFASNAPGFIRMVGDLVGMG